MQDKWLKRASRGFGSIAVAALALGGIAGSTSATATHTEPHDHSGDHNGHGYGHDGGHDHGPAKPDKVEQVPIDSTWQLLAATCNQLPAGSVVDGVGKGVSNQRTVYNKDGSESFTDAAVVTGTATDQNGKKYSWAYKNTWRIANSSANPGLFVGTMTDYFELVGGPLAYTTSFVAHSSLIPAQGVDILAPIEYTGDPVAWAPFSNRCDPL